jgi:hypothetical protein
MNTIPAAQFNENDLLKRVYGVICAHHTLDTMTAERLTSSMHIPEHCVVQVYFADFGRDRDNPLYLSYEVTTRLSPEYDRSTFKKEPGYENEIIAVYTVDSITFYDDEEEMHKHREELRLKTWGDNAKFDYITHVN